MYKKYVPHIPDAGETLRFQNIIKKTYLVYVLQNSSETSEAPEPIKTRYPSNSTNILYTTSTNLTTESPGISQKKKNIRREEHVAN